MLHDVEPRPRYRERDRLTRQRLWTPTKGHRLTIQSTRSQQRQRETQELVRSPTPSAVSDLIVACDGRFANSEHRNTGAVSPSMHRAAR